MQGQDQGTVIITVRRLDETTVEVVVRDDGPGIDPGAVKELLQPFVTTKEAGTGLGLPIATEARFTIVDPAT